jgi:hypothetical protein
MDMLRTRPRQSQQQALGDVLSDGPFEDLGVYDQRIIELHQMN